MQEPDFSMVQESLSATLAKVAMMRAQLSSLKDVLASKEREFETLRQERQEAGADEMITRAMNILKKSADSDLTEIGAAIKNLSRSVPCTRTNNESIDMVPQPPLKENT